MSTRRLQLALNVADLASATDFYARLFGVAPAKQRPGYANFAIADPPLKLVLFEQPDAPTPLNHLGVEVASVDEVGATVEHLARVGLPHRISEQERCCHAVQDKVWVDAPDVPLGAWEFYTVLADDPSQSVACDDTVCCTDRSFAATDAADAGRAPAGDLYVQIQGDAPGVPVVLVHGSWTDADSWQLVAPVLAGERTVVSYDRRGHSRSPWSSPVTRVEDEDDLVGLIESLDRGPVQLVGNSYGASIALGVAARRPDLVAGVVAHEPPLLGAARPGTSLDAETGPVRTLADAVAEMIESGDPVGGAQTFADAVLGEGAWSMLPDELRAAFVSNARTFAGMIRQPGWDVVPVPVDLGVPVLLTAGTASPSWLPAIVDELAGGPYAHADVERYEGAGHVPQLTHADRVVETIRRNADRRG